MTTCHANQRQSYPLPKKVPLRYMVVMPKPSLEEAIVAVFNNLVGTYEPTPRKFAMRAVTWVIPGARPKTWERWSSRETRAVPIREVEILAAAFNLTFEQIIHRARHYQETGAFLPLTPS